ncbi:hypothetical protein IFM89_028760 [Coptis chinensis]|uniref:Uncharacterized protein n=1 Tax=Coptis chinensis TaxID=261450 RepID=A0A835LCV3_9MAGN|nr:hypothetical protein IFM89_028760 [Coptis chinensis]
MYIPWIMSCMQASALSIKERYGSLNLLINAAGILSIPNVLQPETTLSKLQKSSLLLTYEVNTVGPIMVIKDCPLFDTTTDFVNVDQHMWPLLKMGGDSGTERNSAVVANISARVSSIGDNCLGGWHSYRSSKTALNQCTSHFLCYFIELLSYFHFYARSNKDHFGGICTKEGSHSLHTPPTRHSRGVDTDLSKPFQRNVLQDKLFTKEFSLQKLLGIIDSVKSMDNGKFFAWDGQEIPW